MVSKWSIRGHLRPLSLDRGGASQRQLSATYNALGPSHPTHTLLQVTSVKPLVAMTHTFFLHLAHVVTNMINSGSRPPTKGTTPMLVFTLVFKVVPGIPHLLVLELKNHLGWEVQHLRTLKNVQSITFKLLSQFFVALIMCDFNNRLAFYLYSFWDFESVFDNISWVAGTYKNYFLWKAPLRCCEPLERWKPASWDWLSRVPMWE